MILAGRYELITPLGKGAFSEVFRARDMVQGKEVAFKLSLSFLSSGEAARMRHEFRTLTALRHPHVLRTYDYGLTEDGRAFLSLELLEGVSLERMVSGWNEDLARYALQALDALAYIHAEGYVHNDLKPSNLMVSGDRLVVMDFGFAEPQRKLSGEVKGTLGYMAPEALKGAEVDGRADLYSLGVILYEKICGKRPFEEESGLGEIRKALSGNPEPLFVADSKIPPAVNEFVLKLLARHPEERYSSASEAYKALAEALGLEEDIEVKPTSQKPKPGRFVGRNNELSKLKEALTKAQETKQDAVILVSGTEGIGKTSLLSEFKFSCQLEHLPVRWVSEEDELLPLVKELRESKTPSVLLLDGWDEWSKEGREALRAELVDPLDVGLLWVVSGNEKAAFEVLVEEEVVTGNVLLEGLGSDEIRTYVTSILSSFPDLARLIRYIQEQTLGNPRGIEELIRYLYDREILSSFGSEWRVEFDKLPEAWAQEGERAAFDTRLAKLSSQARGVIQVAAVLGPRFKVEILEALSGDSFPLAFQELMTQGWFIPFQSAEWDYAFRVPGHQGYVYEGIPEKEKKVLHQKVGEWYEAQGVRPERLAKHFIASGDLERSFRYSIAAGEEAESSPTGGSKKAAQSFERASILASGLKREEEERALCFKAGKLYKLTGEYNKALEIYGRVESFLKEGCPIERAEIGYHQAEVYLRMNDYDKAQHLLESSLEITGETLFKGMILAKLGMVAVCKDAYEQALTLFAKAEPLLSRFNDLETIVELQMNRFRIFHETGQLDKAKVAIQQAFEPNIPSYRPTLLNCLGIFYRWQRDFQKARETFLLGMQEAEKLNNGVALTANLTNLGLVELNQRNWTRAIEHLSQSLSLTRRSKDRYRMITTENNLCWAYLHKGELLRALSHGKKSMKLSQTLGNQLSISYSYRFLGLTNQRLGCWTEAEQSFRESARISEALGENNRGNTYLYLGRLMLDMQVFEECIKWLDKGLVLEDDAENLPAFYATKAQALAREGRVAEAEDIYIKYLAKVKDLNDEEVLAHCERAWGEILRKKGVVEEAYKAFVSSSMRFSALKDGYEASRSLLAAAEAALDPGSQVCFKEIASLLSEAGETFERMGAAGDLDRAREAKLRLVDVLANDQARNPMRRDMLEAFSKVSELLETLCSEEDIYARILELLVLLFGAERGILFLYDPIEKDLRVAHAYPPELAQDQATLIEARELSRTLSKSSALTAMSDGEVIFTNEALSDERFASRQSVILNRIQALMCAPLKVEGEFIGTVYLDNRIGGALFSSRDLPFFKAVARTVGTAIEKAREYREMVQRTEVLRSDILEQGGLPGMLGTSPKMVELFARARQVAESSAMLLLEGESGTGKEVLAKAIHLLSPRKDKPFVPLDCGALPETLLESELFGHKKGSFTGAFADKLGLFEEAHGGTVFLDEIGSASPAVQAKLLRFLQEGEIRRIGETKPRKVDVRVICATNRDLQEEVAQRRFRRDLYYRLKVISLRIPPLRERGGDIYVLAEHFRTSYAAKLGKDIRGFRREALEAMLRAPWEGNVRELQHAVERAVILAQEPNIGLSDLELRVPETKGKVSFSRLIETQKSQYVQEALKAADGNVSRAARSLGVSYSSFIGLMKRFGMQGPGTKGGRPKERRAE